MRDAAAGFSHEVVQHRLCAFKIRNDAIHERRNHCDIACLTTLHLVGLITDRDDFAGDLVNCNYRRLINDDATAAHSDNCAR